MLRIVFRSALAAASLALNALTSSKAPAAWRTQCFDGGMHPAVSLANGPNLRALRSKGGFDFQAWSYGSEEYGRMIDYMLIVKSATGEDIVTPRIDWFSQILRAGKHALFPNPKNRCSA